MQKDIYSVFHSSVDHLIKRSHGLQSLVAINIAEVQIFLFSICYVTIQSNGPVTLKLWPLTLVISTKEVQR